jgi:hypothetical protein
MEDRADPADIGPSILGEPYVRTREIAGRHSGDRREEIVHRSLGAFQLTMLGVGAIIGTGIFVLTAEAAQKAGPGMMISFIIAGVVCAVAALCYAEMASMVPVSGSAYTYSYAVMGELLAWMVGWALVLEYAVAAGAVAVGWSGYFVGLMREYLGITLPTELVNADALIAQVKLAFGAAQRSDPDRYRNWGVYQPSRIPDFAVGYLAAGDRHQGKRLRSTPCW